MKNNFKKTLLTGSAIIAVSAFSIADANAQAVEIGGQTISAVETNGFVESDGTDPSIEFDSGAGFDVGAEGTASLTNSTATDTTVLVTGANPVVFADDVVTSSTGGIAITVGDATTENSSLTLEGSVTEGTGDVTITLGDGTGTDTNTLLVNSENDENIVIDASVVSADGDTADLDITNVGATGKTITFSDDIGGTTATTALDTITVGATNNQDVDAVFAGNVNATTITLATGAGNDDAVNATFGADGATTTVTGAIAGTAGNTVGVAVAAGADVTFNSALGTNIATIAIGDDGSDTSVVFLDNIASGNITLGSGAGTVDTNTLTLTSGGTLTVAGTIGQGNADDTNNVNITGDTVVTSGTVNADTIAVGAGTTWDADDAITGNVNLTTSSIVEADAGVDGNVANISGTAGQGELILTGTGNVTGTVGADSALSVVALSGTTTFSDTVNANTIDFDNNAGAATFNADVTTNLITFDGYTATVTLADGVDVSGAVDNSPSGAPSGAADPAGTLTLNGSSTIAGNVGATNSLTAVNAGATGSTSVFQGNVTAADVALTADGAVTFAGDVTVANDVTIADDGIATFTGADATVSGTVIGGGAGEGNVVVGNGTDAAEVTFDSTIGTTAALEGFKVSDNATVNLSENVTITSATPGALNFDGTVNVDTTSAGVTIDNTSTGAFGLDGVLNVFGTAANTLTLGSGGTVHAGWNDTAAAANIRNQVVLSDNFLVGDSAGDAYRINVGATDGVFDPTSTYALDATAGIVRIADGSVLTVGIDENSDIALEDGDQVFVIDSSGDLSLGTADNTGDSNANYSYEEALAGGQLVIGDTGLLSLTVNDSNDAQDLVLDVAIQDAAAAFAGGSTGVGAANALVALGAGAGGDADLDAIRVSLLSANSADAQTIAESVSPVVSGGAEKSSVQASQLSVNTVNSRMDSVRGGNADTGMSSGEIAHGVNAWVQGFGQTAEQGFRDGVAGYDADTFGVAVGVDTENMFDDTVVGVAVSYANSDIEGNDANTTDTDVDSYQVSLYGNHDYRNNFYTSGLLGFAYNNIDQTRNNVATIAGNDANADYDSQQYIAYVETGKKHYVNDNAFITPHVLAHYQHIAIDDYTETGSTANMSVDTDSLNILELGVGVRGEMEFADTAGNSIRPSAEVGYRYDVIGDEVQATSTFTGGGASFDTNGADPAQSAFNAGVGVTYELQNNWSFTADYDYQAKSDFDAHAGLVRANYKF